MIIKITEIIELVEPCMCGVTDPRVGRSYHIINSY